MAHILVIDGDETVRSELSSWLQGAGHRVEVAEDGRHGLALIERDAPDLVITELYMDGMEGMEFLCRLRERPRSGEVITMTTHDRVGSRDMVSIALLLGASAHLEKPLARAHVFQVVGGVLDP